jgi:hypothetical protein
MRFAAVQETVQLFSILFGEAHNVLAHVILPERKRIRSEPSALNQLNNEHDDGYHEQKMNQSAANVADKAQKPEHH